MSKLALRIISIVCLLAFCISFLAFEPHPIRLLTAFLALPWMISIAYALGTLTFLEPQKWIDPIRFYRLALPSKEVVDGRAEWHWPSKPKQ